MIIICMVTDVFPSLALVQEKAESNLLYRPPANPFPDAVLVDWKLLA
jgi:sodium/potassium-transporting ATPase subunit alpha